MNTPFLLVTILFVVISVAMVLIILVQRPSGGGLAGAFGGAGGGGSDTVFGGRVGDALTWATVVCFVLYLGIAVTLNKVESSTPLAAQDQAAPTLEVTPGAPVEVPGTDASQPSNVRPIITPTPPPASTPAGETESPTETETAPAGETEPVTEPAAAPE